MKRVVVIILGTCAVAACQKAAKPQAPVATEPARSQPDSLREAPWRVGVNGTGPIRYGMTVAEAQAAVGTSPLDELPRAGESCDYYFPHNAPRRIGFMVVDGRIARVDVDSAIYETDRGAHIGMTEADIHRIYPEDLRVMPHKYIEGGHYLVLVPKAPGDSMLRILFETDGAKVTRLRAGRYPAVGYVEGCA